MKIIFTLLFLFTLNTISACDCSRINDLNKTQKESYISSKLIFIGKLVESKEDGTYKFQISEFLKGNNPDSTISGKYQNSCSTYPKKIGKTWMVYTTPDGNGIIDIDECGLSRSFDYPFLHNEKASIYPPPNDETVDLTLSLINFYRLKAVYTEQALDVLKEEIEQIRMWRNN